MPSSCKDIRAALATCLLHSDCVLISRHTPSDCLRPPLLTTLPTQCQQLKKGYGECKRGMVDMRKRFRGNAPVAVSLELEAGGGTGGGRGGGAGERDAEGGMAGLWKKRPTGAGGQLYGGRNAVGERGTSGREDEGVEEEEED